MYRIKKLTYDWRLDAGEFVADQISPAVTVLLALDLLAADLLVCGAAKEAFRTGADRLVAEGRADGVAATNDRAAAGVLTLKQAVVAAHTRVLLPALNIRPTPGLLDTEAVLAGVEQRALRRVLALGNAGAAHADLVVQTLSGG